MFALACMLPREWSQRTKIYLQELGKCSNFFPWMKTKSRMGSNKASMEGSVLKHADINMTKWV